MKPYLWMTDYTPQTEWIDRQGLLLWLAFFFTEMGAGLYLVSLFFHFWKGCIAGWLISAILGGGLHTLYLGRPERAWRAVLRPLQSELSRGLIIMIFFLLLGAIQLAPSLPGLGSLPWQSDALFLRGVVGILAFLVVLHGFMTMNVMASIPFWNSAILPILSIASGVWVGSQLTLFFAMALSERELMAALEPVARGSLFSYTLLIVFYLWNARHSSSAVKESLGVMLKGGMSFLFYPGVVLVGLLVPLAVTVSVLAGDGVPSQGVLVLRVGCAVLGDAVLRYVITKCGRYSPLIYSNLVKG